VGAGLVWSITGTSGNFLSILVLARHVGSSNFMTDAVMILLKQSTNAGVEVLKQVVMKSTTFLDITWCSALKVNQCFRGTCHLHLQSQRISQARHGIISQKTELFNQSMLAAGNVYIIFFALNLFLK
jgi:hypothetical protein